MSITSSFSKYSVIAAVKTQIYSSHSKHVFLYLYTHVLYDYCNAILIAVLQVDNHEQGLKLILRDGLLQKCSDSRIWDSLWRRAFFEICAGKHWKKESEKAKPG